MTSKKYYPTYEEMVRIIDLNIPVNATLRSYTIFLYALDEETEFELDVLGVSTVTFGGINESERNALKSLVIDRNYRINVIN